MKRPILLILLTAIAIYLPTLWYGFSPMDEQWVILDQQALMSSFSNLPKLFSSSTLEMYYRPIWTSSFMLDFIIGKGSPFTFHLTNIIIHSLCCILIFKLFTQLEFDRTLSTCCALIFAVHPINVHSVAWIPGRNDSLLCLFTLLSVLFLIKYFKENRLGFLLIHMVGFCLALLTKENAIVLPILFVAIGLLIFKKKIDKNFIMVAVIWIAITVWWFLLRKSIVNVFPSSGIHNFTESITNFASAITIYIGKSVFPIQQSVLPLLQFTSVIPGLIVIAILIFLLLKFGVKDKYMALFGMLWFFLFICIPTWVGATNHNGEHYEHRIYTSLVGFLILASEINLKMDKKVATYLFVSALIVLSFKTITRYPVYSDELSYAIAGANEAPTNAMLHNIEGIRYSILNNNEKAIECFTKAIELRPNNAVFYNGRFTSYRNLKDYAHALADCDKTIELLNGTDTRNQRNLINNSGLLYFNRSTTHFYLGHYQLAMDDMQQAVKFKYASIPLNYITDLNNAFLKEKIISCSAKISQNPNDASNYNSRGVAYCNLKNFKQAVVDFNMALALEPNTAGFIYNRFQAYTALGDKLNAEQDQKRLIKLGFKNP